MSSENSYVRRHHVNQPLPLITPCIEFKLSPRPPLPVLTSHMEFKPEELAIARTAEVYGPIVQRRVTFDIPADEASQESPDVRASSSSPSTGGLPSMPPRPSMRKIPKPQGEPGRPGSGGFSTEKILVETYNWTIEQVEELMEAVRRKVRKKLDTTVSFRGQKKDLIEEICEKMMEQPDRWPELEDYNDCWPVISMIKLVLKYQSEASRRTKEKATTRQVLEAARGRTPDV